MRYFENLHPICIFIYFVAVIGLSLACFHPVMMLLSLTGAFLFLEKEFAMRAERIAHCRFGEWKGTRSKTF